MFGVGGCLMKGIVLAGGSGSRLYPITKGVSKHLLLFMISHDILCPFCINASTNKGYIINHTQEDVFAYQRLLGSGDISLVYIFSMLIQPSPDGLAQAFIIGEEFIAM